VLNKHMHDQGFEVSTADSCIYYRINEEEYTIVAVYVDDLIMICQDMKTVEEFKFNLRKEFKIKELGEMKEQKQQDHYHVSTGLH
jgi:Reverse transcriptase (RNA-dependent DNA polymerase)